MNEACMMMRGIRMSEVAAAIAIVVEGKSAREESEEGEKRGVLLLELVAI